MTKKARKPQLQCRPPENIREEIDTRMERLRELKKWTNNQIITDALKKYLNIQ